MSRSPDLLTIRTGLALQGYQPFTEERAEEIVQNVAIPRQSMEVLWITKGNSITRKRITDVFDRLNIRSQAETTPAFLSAQYATDVAVVNFRMPAAEALGQEMARSFIFFFDCDLAAARIAANVLWLAQPRNPQSKDIATLTREISGNATTSDIAEIYMKREQLVLGCQTILGEDLTGVDLVRESVKQTTGGPNRIGPSPLPPFLIPQFVAAGAGFTEAIYTAVYPRIDTVYKKLPKGRGR